MSLYQLHHSRFLGLLFPSTKSELSFLSGRWPLWSILVSFLFITASQAQVRYVQAGATGDGLSAATPSGSLTAMLSSVSGTGGTVLVGGGLYAPTTGTARTASFSIASGVQLYGGYNADFTGRALPGQPGSTTLSGNIGSLSSINDNSYHVIRFRNASADTRLDGVVITAGNANGSGVDSRGGGIYNDGGGSGNVSNPVITNCIITANRASTGGGVYNWGQGGNSSPTLINCLFFGNASTATFFSVGAGAIYNDGRNSGRSNPLVINCTIVNNTVGNLGVAQAIYTDGRTSGQSSLTLINTIVWNNGGDNAIENNTNGNTVVRYSLIEPGEADYTTAAGTPTTISSDPLFVDAAGNNFQLRGCSPAINAGNPATSESQTGTLDLASNSRFFDNGPVDLGAYEYQEEPQTPVAITGQPPASSAVCPGGTVTASFSYTGPAASIQWFRGNTALTGIESATTTTLTLNNITQANAGTYRAVVTGGCNSVTTTAFQLNLAQPAGFSSQPSANAAICPGGTATASISASGTGPFSYQWYKNGTILTGISSATTNALTLPNASAADAGSYVVVVTGACTSATSTAYNLTIRPTVVYVTPTGAGTGDGSTVSNALAGTALRGALTSACASTTFLLSGGLYRPTEGQDRSASFVIPSGIQVYGGNDAGFTSRTTNPASTTLSGEIGNPGNADNSYHVVRFTNVATSTRLDGVLVTGGNANSSLNPDFYGGGILVDGSSGKNTSPTIVNCTFVDNSASSSGGAIRNSANAGTSSPVISNCLFLNNFSNSNGGAISNNGDSNGNCSPLITSCQFLNNSARVFGGAIENTAATATITSSTFSSNNSPEGGGGINNVQGNNTISNGTFNNNTSRYGGAVSQSSGSLIVSNCTMASNTATSGGGAIEASTASLTIQQSVFVGNRSLSGAGAIDQDGGSSSIINCQFLSNSASSSGGGFYVFRGATSSLINCEFNGNSAQFGGGIYNSDATPIFRNCTFYGNLASSNGRAIYTNSNTATLINTIIWNNGGQNALAGGSGGSVSASYCLIEPGETDYSVVGGTPATLTGNPLFIDAPNGNLRLSACSPAVNTGNPNTTPADVGNTDLAGQPRFFNNERIDMGAYELQSTGGPSAAITGQPLTGAAVCIGGTATASVTASGANSFQWYRGNDLLNGQTSATLSLTNVQPADTGDYRVVVTGCGNSVTSTAFSLTVNQPAFASAPAPSQTVVAPGGPLTLSFLPANPDCPFNPSNPFWVELATSPTPTTLTVSAVSSQSLAVVVPNNLTPSPYPLRIGYNNTVFSPYATLLIDAPLSISASQTTLCAGGTVLLEASGCESGVVQWSTGQTGRSIEIIPQSTTAISVSCVVSTGGAPRQATPVVDGDKTSQRLRVVDRPNREGIKPD